MVEIISYVRSDLRRHFERPMRKLPRVALSVDDEEDQRAIVSTNLDQMQLFHGDQAGETQRIKEELGVKTGEAEADTARLLERETHPTQAIFSASRHEAGLETIISLAEAGVAPTVLVYDVRIMGGAGETNLRNGVQAAGDASILTGGKTPVILYTAYGGDDVLGAGKPLTESKLDAQAPIFLVQKQEGGLRLQKVAREAQRYGDVLKALEAETQDRLDFAKRLITGVYQEAEKALGVRGADGRKLPLATFESRKRHFVMSDEQVAMRRVNELLNAIGAYRVFNAAELDSKMLGNVETTIGYLTEVTQIGDFDLTDQYTAARQRLDLADGIITQTRDRLIAIRDDLRDGQLLGGELFDRLRAVEAGYLGDLGAAEMMDDSFGSYVGLNYLEEALSTRVPGSTALRYTGTVEPAAQTGSGGRDDVMDFIHRTFGAAASEVGGQYNGDRLDQVAVGLGAIVSAFDYAATTVFREEPTDEVEVYVRARETPGAGTMTFEVQMYTQSTAQAEAVVEQLTGSQSGTPDAAYNLGHRVLCRATNSPALASPQTLARSGTSPSVVTTIELPSAYLTQQ